MDYHTLNKYLARDNHPLPSIEDQLMILNNKKYFGRLDLKNGFFHINMAPESVKYTAFVSPLGHQSFRSFRMFKTAIWIKSWTFEISTIHL